MKLSEEEKKLYKTLNDMTQLTLKYPMKIHRKILTGLKPEVEKETYDPF